jgi:putative endonuclease
MNLFTVYVLYSEKYAKHYTGYTSDLTNRLISHNELGNDWTKRYRPWKLIYTKEFSLKSEAMKHEKWLKSGVGRNYIMGLAH